MFYTVLCKRDGKPTLNNFPTYYVYMKQGCNRLFVMPDVRLIHKNGFDFKRSSKKAWSLLQRLNCYNISHNRISHTVSTSRAPQIWEHITKVKRELHALLARSTLAPLPTSKSLGFDGIHPEYIIDCGKYARELLARFYTKIQSGKIPYKLMRASILVIL